MDGCEVKNVLTEFKCGYQINMLGRFAALVTRSIPMAPRLTYMPKYQLSQINQQTSSMIDKTTLVPGNLLIRNLMEMLEKLTEEPEPEVNKNVKTISLMNQGTLRMSHEAFDRDMNNYQQLARLFCLGFLSIMVGMGMFCFYNYFGIRVTMYKYTYLLSDSYRHEGTVPSQYGEHGRPCDGGRYLNGSDIVNYGESSINMLQQLKQQYHNYEGKARQTQSGFYGRRDVGMLRSDQIGQERQRGEGRKDDLQVRLRNLVDLGERTDEALRDVELKNKLKKISDKYTQKNGSQKYRERLEQQTHFQPRMDRSKASGYERQSNNIPQREHALERQVSFSRIPLVSHSVERMPLNRFKDSRMDKLSLTKQPEPVRDRQRKPHAKYDQENTVTRKDVKELISNHINKIRKDGQEAVHEYKNRQDREPLRLETFNQSRPREDSSAVQKLSSLQDKIQASLRPYRDI